MGFNLYHIYYIQHYFYYIIIHPAFLFSPITIKAEQSTNELWFMSLCRLVQDQCYYMIFINDGNTHVHIVLMHISYIIVNIWLVVLFHAFWTAMHADSSFACKDNTDVVITLLPLINLSTIIGSNLWQSFVALQED